MTDTQDTKPTRKVVPNFTIENRQIDYLMRMAIHRHRRCESASQLLRLILDEYMEKHGEVQG